MTTVQITHTMTEGTCITGLPKSDLGRYRPVMRANQWKWSGNIGVSGAYHQRQSRYQLPRTWRIEDTKTGLEELGYEVTVSIDTTPRDMAESEADRAERIEGYADRQRERGERRVREGDAKAEVARQFFRDLQGEPIHNTRDRNRREKLSDQWDRGIELMGQGERNLGRAVTADRHMDHRNSPQAVANRVETLKAEIRKCDLEINEGVYYGPGVRIPHDEAGITWWKEQRANYQNQLDYWQAMKDQYLADGALKEITPEYLRSFEVPQVRVGGRWHTVEKINRKTVAVRTFRAAVSPYRWFTLKVEIHKIRDVREAPEHIRENDVEHGSVD